MGFTITEKDLGMAALQKLAGELARGETYVKAGVLGGTRDDGLDNVELAMIHEFGAPGANIPERSFLRSSFDANRGEYEALIKQLCRDLYSGKGDLPRGLGQIGLKMVADVQAKINDGPGIPPPLKPATIAAKGSSRPLVDTGQLKRSIVHKVVIAGGG